MPTWGGILEELKTSSPDAVRRKYLRELAAHVHRDVILYSTRWTDPSNTAPEAVSITEEDLQGFMEVVHGLKNPCLDLILHSPGGSLVAAEAIVKYLRKKFEHIRVIVPQAAMSAGTMIACAGNAIMMGKHSFLGPIDPQFVLHTPLGPRMVPAQAILDQFELAKEECKHSENLGPWLPILSQYGPRLLIECKNAIRLSRELVKEWLAEYMFPRDKRPSHKASFVARSLADHKSHMSHGRHLSRDDCKRLGLTIQDLESDQQLQDLLLSVFHASTHTFSQTPAVKIIENQNERAFIKLAQTIRVHQQPPASFPPGRPVSQPSAPVLIPS
jgi:hypothetical protein